MTSGEASDPFSQVRYLLEEIVFNEDDVRLGECLRGIHLPTLGGPDEPADLLVKALSLQPVDPTLGFALARVLGALIEQQLDALSERQLSSRQHRLLYNALLLACSLPPADELFAGLKRLSNFVDGRDPLDVLDASRAASRLRRALAFQQVDDSLEEQWLELMTSISIGAKGISTSQRAALIEAWEGLLWIPPGTLDEPVVHVGRIDRGLRRLHEVTAGHDGSFDVLQRAVEVLADTFPRSTGFWVRELSPLWPDWPENLRHAIGERWPGLVTEKSPVRRFDVNLAFASSTSARAVEYDTYLHNVPKVSDDGLKYLPVAPFQTKKFVELEEAQKFAADHKDEFDRVVVIRTMKKKQRMIERYMDGEHIVNDGPDESEAAEAEAAEAEAAGAEAVN